MAKLTKEQIMVGADMADLGTSIRQIAKQMGVTEGALRYRLKQRAEDPKPDGRSFQPTSLDGLEDAVTAVLEGLECYRVTGEGRPAFSSSASSSARRT
jgi:hypothetical protein